MNKPLHLIGIAIGLLSLVGGIADIAIQYIENGEVVWRIPIILIGVGVGLPIIIFPFTDFKNRDEEDLSQLSEQEYAQHVTDNFSSGFFESSSATSGHSDSSDTGGDYSGDGGGE